MIILKSKYFNTPINTPDSSQEEKKKGMNPALAGGLAAAGAGIGSRVVIGAALRPFERKLWDKHNKKFIKLDEELEKERESEIDELKRQRDSDWKKVKDAEQAATDYHNRQHKEWEETSKKIDEWRERLKPFDEKGLPTENYGKYLEKIDELKGLNIYNDKEYDKLYDKYTSLADEVCGKDWNDKIAQAEENWREKTGKAHDELFKKTTKKADRINLIGRKIAPVAIGLGTGALVYNRYRNKKKKEEI
jgi:chromosome segregation ATPase